MIENDIQKTIHFLHMTFRVQSFFLFPIHPWHVSLGKVYASDFDHSNKIRITLQDTYLPFYDIAGSKIHDFSSGSAEHVYGIIQFWSSVGYEQGILVQPILLPVFYTFHIIYLCECESS